MIRAHLSLVVALACASAVIWPAASEVSQEITAATQEWVKCVRREISRIAKATTESADIVAAAAYGECNVERRAIDQAFMKKFGISEGRAQKATEEKVILSTRDSAISLVLRARRGEDEWELD